MTKTERDLLLLEALLISGVDGWEGWDYALQLYFKMLHEKDVSTVEVNNETT